MPFLDAVLGRVGLARKQSPTNPGANVAPGESVIINDGRGNRPTVRVTYGLGSAGWTRREYLPQVEYGYTRNADVYACVSLIAQAGAQVKWWDDSGNSKSLLASVKYRDAAGKVQRKFDPTPLYASMFGAEKTAEVLKGDRAAAYAHMTKAATPTASIALLRQAGGATFVHDWISYLLLSGNSFIEEERIGNRLVTLWLDRPDRVRLVPGLTPPRGRPREWRVYNAYGGFQDLPNAERIIPQGAAILSGRNSIVQSKLFNPLDDVYGMAPLDAAMYQVDTTNEGLALTKKLMQRGYSPGWISAAKDSDWDQTQVAAMKQTIRESRAAGEEMFFQNAEYHTIGFAPQQSGVYETKILAKRDIAAVYHVPSQLIGDTESQTYSNYREARRALYTEAAIPLLVMFRDDWNRTIGAELNSPLDFDKDTFDAIASAREEATDRTVKTFTSGLIMQNEGRKELEWDEVPDGDVFYAPANIVPLGEGGQAAAAPEPPAPPKAAGLPDDDPIERTHKAFVHSMNGAAR